MTKHHKLGFSSTRDRVVQTLRLAGWAGVTFLAIQAGCSSSEENNGQGNETVTCNDNGVIDPGEQCDGLNVPNCSVATSGQRPIGTPTCVGCLLDTNSCYVTGAGAGGSSNPGGNPGYSGSPDVPGSTGGSDGTTGGSPGYAGETGTGGITN